MFAIMGYGRWLKIILFNFLLVAIAGLVMRYKIVWSLPWIHQKHLLHAHSHFAFAGWVSLALYYAMVRRLYPERAPRLMNSLLLMQWLASLGMLFTFPLMGYAAPSIFFSTLTIFIGYAFAWYLWKPLNILGEAGIWIKIGLISNLLSSIGTFFLAWLMQQPGFSQQWYVFSVYFFLHFQYNGWFFFSIIGLYLDTSLASKIHSVEATSWKKARILMTIAVLPALLLSALWMDLGLGFWVVAAIAALLQVLALAWMIKALHKCMPELLSPVRYIWFTSFLALSVKIILQLLSCLPGMSVFAFGYRPLVVAYLHLVLLGFVSLFLFGYFLRKGWMQSGWGVRSIWLAIIINEIVLIIQGLSAIGYLAVPYANEVLFLNTVWLVAGAGKMVLAHGRDHH